MCGVVVPAPIVQASGRGFTIEEPLVEAGADKEKAAKDGWTPLLNACMQGHIEVARLLLLVVEAGAGKDKSATSGLTPLLAAYHWGHI
jgi:ankyrin repeat protein